MVGVDIAVYRQGSIVGKEFVPATAKGVIVCRAIGGQPRFDARVVPAVASAVADAAVRTGVARRKR